MDKHAKILVVDDDEDIRRTMKAIIADAGYLGDLASTGKEALAMTEKEFYNVALIDIRLPDMEGTELLKKITDDIPRTRKVIVTGYPTLHNAIASVNDHADAYLIKPVDAEEILNIISQQLKLQKEKEEMSETKVAEFIETRVKETANGLNQTMYA